MTRAKVAAQHQPAELIAAVEVDEQGLASKVLDYSTWSRKEYYWMMAGILGHAFMYSFEIHIVGGTQDFIQSSLEASSLLSVTPTVVQILQAALVPFFTKISDVIGRAEALTIALAFYLLGYIVSGTASGFAQFASGSIFNGIGTTGTVVLTQVLVAGKFFLGTWEGSMINIFVAQALLNPLTRKGFSWHNIYIIASVAVVVGAIFVLTPLWYLQRKGERRLGKRPRRSIQWFLNEFDAIGSLLLAGGLSLTLFPLMLAGTYDDGWQNPTILGCIVAGCVTLLLLFVWEAKFTSQPILPTRIWRNPTVFGGMFIQFVFTMMIAMNWTYFATYLYVSRPVTLAAAMLLMRGYQITYMVLALTTGVLMKKFNTCRPFVWGGILIMTLGCGLMIPARHPSSSDAFVVASQAVAGGGAGICNIAASVAITGAVHRRDMATVIGASQIINSIASALGGAIAGAVWTQLLPNRLRRHVTGELDFDKAINEAFTVRDLPEPTYSQVVRAYSDSQEVLTIITVCLVVLGLLTAFPMKHVDLLQSQNEQDTLYGGSRNDDTEAQVVSKTKEPAETPSVVVGDKEEIVEAK
ncbi:hypothetical protein DFQ26_005256 [Actinomortierella ambigua]|nr:hypothetical protein DFQ26_005256 [Actinomortierella ambigua]